MTWVQIPSEAAHFFFEKKKSESFHVLLCFLALINVFQLHVCNVHAANLLMSCACVWRCNVFGRVWSLHWSTTYWKVYTCIYCLYSFEVHGSVATYMYVAAGNIPGYTVCVYSCWILTLQFTLGDTGTAVLYAYVPLTAQSGGIYIQCSVTTMYMCTCSSCYFSGT